MQAALLFVLAAAFVGAQDPSTVVTSVAPAATTVTDTPPDAGVDLFEAETVQLTEGVITDLLNNDEVAQFADLFAFANSSLGTESERRRRLRRSAQCKTAPGDLLWPSALAWDIFDLLLGGALNPVVPIASVCYPKAKSDFNDYNAAKCEAVTDAWTDPATHYNSDNSMMFPLYEGSTCVQGTNTSALTTCTLGGFASYSVHVSNVAQIQLAVNLARTLNLRLVVKNTGHDYNGRSTGKYALSLWTHNLKGIQYVSNYKSSVYSGPVFKVGAGVQGFEIYQAAEQYGVTAVAGICPTVGIYGGYSTGGGHSPVMQLFGMGADQVLELQVVTAAGLFITVSQTSYPDLYWAMLGGGGGTFGVITSAVVKVHPKIPVTSSVWNFTTSATVSEDTFWQGVKAFWDEIPKYNAAKTYSYFSMMKLAPGTYTFNMFPFWATNMTVAEYNTLTQPLFTKLKALGIDYQIETKYFDRIYPAYEDTFATIDFHVGSTDSTPGNRIVPKELWNNATLSDEVFNAVKNSVDLALLVEMYHQMPADIPIVNSVNPAFRHEGGMIVFINLITDDSPAGLQAGNAVLTNDIIGPVRALTPTGGSYANEAEISEPNWQQSFWGANYPRLLSIKTLWDPTGLFYVHHGVGSENWVVDDGDQGVQTQNGKLCRVS